MAIVRDITQQYLDEVKIRYLNEHDQLTDLMNRRFFESEIKVLSESDQCPVSIIMIDVNGLKLINDSFGHHRGDELLIKVADILRKTCENKGHVSRIGGDEFVVMLPLCSYEKTREIVNQIHYECSRYQVSGLGVSVSIGWATKVSPGEDLHEVLIKAEDFMYKEKLLEAPGMHGEAINAIMHTLYEKNQREEEHSQRVSKLSYALAKALYLSDEDCNELKTVALLHDIGKIAIPETILNKPGRLSHDEFQEIKKHPEIGFRILSSINSMAAMGGYVLSHHERWDGMGYPRGLQKEEIPFLARIITIADAYDAMTSERSYKKKMTKRQAAEEIEGNLGTQFDPILGRVFINRVLLVTLEELDA
jgi:diguanylate cyclase (GGDEF)-like protein/putative nucleotidyltransferase with HDIG domain